MVRKCISINPLKSLALYYVSPDGISNSVVNEIYKIDFNPFVIGTFWSYKVVKGLASITIGWEYVSNTVT